MAHATDDLATPVSFQHRPDVERKRALPFSEKHSVNEAQHVELAYRPATSMCYVIVTCRTALWALMSLGATLVVIAGIITPQWIVGKEEEVDYLGWYVNATVSNDVS